MRLKAIFTAIFIHGCNVEILMFFIYNIYIMSRKSHSNKKRNHKILNIIIAVDCLLIVSLLIFGTNLLFFDNQLFVSTMNISASYENPISENLMPEPTQSPVLPASTPIPITPIPTAEPVDEPAEEQPAHTPIMIFTGDVLLDGSVRNIINSQGLDAVFPVEYRAPFHNADIVMINLEMPMSNRGTPDPDKEFSFRGDPSGIVLLSDMGVSIVTLANNHTLDYGREAFLDTLELLEQNSIKYVGGGRDKAEAMQWVTLHAGDKNIAFLAASRVIPTTDWYATLSRSGLFGTYDPTELNRQITLAKKEADYVIVYVHWGVERNTIPENWQRTMAFGYIDAGADAVVACHPHVLQGFEFYSDKLIAYSLGNFIFTNDQRDTAALELTINTDGGLSARIYPYEIINRSTVMMTDPDKLERLKGHLNEISFNAVIDSDFNIIKTP